MVGSAAAKGAKKLHRVARVAGAVYFFEPCRQFGVEDISSFGEGGEAVGLQYLRPEISIIPRGIAAAGKQVLEMRKAMPQTDLRRYGHPLQKFALEPGGIGRHCRSSAMQF